MVAWIYNLDINHVVPCLLFSGKKGLKRFSDGPVGTRRVIKGKNYNSNSLQLPSCVVEILQAASLRIFGNYTTLHTIIRNLFNM